MTAGELFFPAYFRSVHRTHLTNAEARDNVAFPDSYPPDINCLDITQKGLLIMGDVKNNVIKSLLLSDPFHRLLVNRLGTKGCEIRSLRVLADGKVAVIRRHYVSILRIEGRSIAEESCHATVRIYNGVEEHPDKKNLLVSSDIDNVHESCIEMINRFGVILKCIVPSQALGTFTSPRNFAVIGKEIFLPNPQHGLIMSLSFEKRSANIYKDTFGMFFERPVHVSVDSECNMYIICDKLRTVTLIDTDCESQILLSDPNFGDIGTGRVVPCALCLTTTGFILTSKKYYKKGKRSNGASVDLFTIEHMTDDELAEERMKSQQRNKAKLAELNVANWKPREVASTKEQSTKEQSTKEQPTKEQPTKEQPTEEQPTKCSPERKFGRSRKKRYSRTFCRLREERLRRQQEQTVNAITKETFEPGQCVPELRDLSLLD